jgi:hypothetical protein
MKKFFYWLQKEEGWKSIMAIIYALICVMDFILIPIGLNAMRKEVLDDGMKALLNGLDPVSQVEFIKAIYRQYTPLTLQGNGVFHLSFGAILTGSALSKNSRSEETK